MASFFAPQMDKFVQRQYAEIDRKLAAGELTPAEAADQKAAWGGYGGEFDKGGSTSGTLQASVNAVPGSQETLSNVGREALGNTANVKLASADPDAYKMLQMHLGAMNAQAQRPNMEQAGLNMLGNTLSAFRPMNSVLGSMYGSQGQIDTTQAMKSPMPPGMTSIGAPNQGDIGLARPPQGGGGPPQSTGPGLLPGPVGQGQYGPTRVGQGDPIREALMRLGQR